MRKQFMNPIITIGRDDRGNEHRLMQEPDGKIKDLYNEILYKKGEPIHAYYSRLFNEVANG
jgi:hypothetical protein